MIKYSTGYIERVLIKSFKGEDENLLNGSNKFRSSKGKPYKVGNDTYLERIFPLLWQDVKNRGLHAVGSIYELSEKVYNEVIIEKQVLPDDFYDAIFLTENKGANEYSNPYTGLTIVIRDKCIISCRRDVKKCFLVEKGSGSAHNSYNNNPKSVKHYRHTFLRHGQGEKITRSLTGRAASTGQQQGHG